MLPEQEFSEEEAETRRNETLRQMLSTPPQQHASHPPPLARSRKKAGPGVVPEIELAQVAVQMLLAAVLINATHTAFEDRKDTFHGVGMDVAPDILTG